MADVKISALPVATAVVSTDVVPLISGGLTTKATVTQLANAVDAILGLNNMATQDASSVAITGGNIAVGALNIESATLIRDPLLEDDSLVIWNSESDTNARVTMKQILEFIQANIRP